LSWIPACPESPDCACSRLIIINKGSITLIATFGSSAGEVMGKRKLVLLIDGLVSVD